MLNHDNVMSVQERRKKRTKSQNFQSNRVTCGIFNLCWICMQSVLISISAHPHLNTHTNIHARLHTWMCILTYRYHKIANKLFSVHFGSFNPTHSQENIFLFGYLVYWIQFNSIEFIDIDHIYSCTNKELDYCILTQ